MRSMPKSRSGCARCKRQHLKCDEAKPACGRCERVGAQCPGYAKPLKWSTKYEKVIQPHRSTPKQPSRPSFSSEAEPQPPLSGFGFNPSGSISLVDGLPIDHHELIFQGFGCVSDEQLKAPTLEVEERSLLSSLMSTGITYDIQFISERPDLDQASEVVHANTVRSSTNFMDRHQNLAVSPCPSLTDTGSVLTEFYFKDVAAIFSVYDSQMNPFRTAVFQQWDSSRLIHCCLQSMAAACLSDKFPQMGLVGRELRREAISILETESTFDHKSLLALLMLGGTTSWHDPKDLGVSFFNLARRRIKNMTASGQLQRESNNYHFFEESLIYWELLLSYVADNTSTGSMSERLPQPIYFPVRPVPHPWTGIARDTQIVVKEVGILVRKTRLMAHSRRFATESHIHELQRAIKSAHSLEEKLLSFVYPGEKDIICPGDRETPVWHLLTLAEIYRRTGLLQLYRVFPDLLRRRLPQKELFLTTLAPSLSGIGSDLDENSQLKAHNEWLTTFALDTLDMLQPIPVESGTRDFQPFLLVASCSELKFPPLHEAAIQADDVSVLDGLHNFDYHSLTVPIPRIYRDKFCGRQPIQTLESSPRAIKIARARQCIQDRLTSFLRLLPPKPMRVCLDIVKLTWEKLDNHPNSLRAEENIYWMDVMIENGWETCMG